MPRKDTLAPCPEYGEDDSIPTHGSIWKDSEQWESSLEKISEQKIEERFLRVAHVLLGLLAEAGQPMGQEQEEQFYKAFVHILEPSTAQPTSLFVFMGYLIDVFSNEKNRKEYLSFIHSHRANSSHLLLNEVSKLESAIPVSRSKIPQNLYIHSRN